MFLMNWRSIEEFGKTDVAYNSRKAQESCSFWQTFWWKASPPFEFLANVTDEDKQQLFDIFTNLNITKAEKQTQMQQWAANQSEDVQTALTNLTQSRQNATQNAFAKAAYNLTEEAASLLTQIQEVVENQDITQLEECSQIQTLLSEADRSVALQLHIPRIPCNALYGKSGHARIGKIFGHKRGLH
uniref:SXP/RAL-2 family protein Ani s 5-like cation-binding domain-containing protein n=1 Tax=Ditylenchus dipsaci TaxID=166011 RepID=A0A915DV32_9BILA